MRSKIRKLFTRSKVLQLKHSEEFHVSRCMSRVKNSRIFCTSLNNCISYAEAKVRLNNGFNIGKVRCETAEGEEEIQEKVN